MRKTFESIDRHVDVSSAYMPVHPEARDCSDSIPQIDVDEVMDIDRNVRDIDPAVVVYNHRYRIEDIDFYDEYPLVHIRHGASIGRGEVDVTVASIGHAIDVALAPGERWARRYREAFPDDVRVAVVGIPEADDLVAAESPRQKRVLYAPTNHNYGGGSYLATAETVLDTFADTEYELLFRPHPMDQTEEPGRSLTQACRERIASLPNVIFDEHSTPGESMLNADILISDYSGIVAEWLHTGRPLIQFTDIAAEDNTVPEIGNVMSIADFDVSVIDDLYNHGSSKPVAKREAAFRAELGIPMDGHAGERAATEVIACTR
ncbi:CDP-glycerol glycerophosphotransferase family protein [Haladaptatus caseinilyticus]|uniref:CDP-glycerol glycerophosphotransferase family protein n=1 Tax=Haladaptatus caseinilyticus TaxID=2993314 RepID=UPI00224B064C|nr:CDP-glycerol glycerophosphotransferase family protein [Haladaptatus caseinilyticus]